MAANSAWLIARMPKYATTFGANPDKNQLRSDETKPIELGRTIALTPALVSATTPAARIAASRCRPMAPTRGFRSSLHQSPSRMTTGVTSAHAYHPGASPTNARATDIGRLLIRANTTVSNVERTAGIDQIANSKSGDRRGRDALSADGELLGGLCPGWNVISGNSTARSPSRRTRGVKFFGECGGGRPATCWVNVDCLLR